MIRGRRARGVSRAAAIAVVSLGVWGAARPAAAYVRYRTAATNALFAWPQSRVPMSVYPDSMKDANGFMDLTTDQILHAAQTSAAAWSVAANPCSFLDVTVEVAPQGAAVPIARYDYKNSLVFQTLSWGSPNSAYDSSALAITSVFANKSNGQIRDADIEVNALNFLWADLDLNPTEHGKQDLQNALTHEMGHLIGLDHTCYVSGVPPLDDKGVPIPSCDDAPADVQATTMFASAVPGDVGKRTLAPDEKQAICDMYPLVDDPRIYPTTSTPPPESSGCAVASGGRDHGALALLAALGAFVAATRRRARSG